MLLPVPEALPELETVLGLPAALATMYLVGSHPAKMVTFLALNSFQEGEYVTKERLVKRLEQMRGGGDGWMPTRSTVYGYCRDALKPLDLIEFGTTMGTKGSIKKEGMVGAVRVTERGRRIGPTVVGALLHLELQSIKQERFGDGYPLPLQIALGKPLLSKERITGVPTRLRIYDALLHAPEGLPQVELKRAAGVSHTGIVVQVQDLCHLDILTKEDSHGEKRYFELSEDISELGSRFARSSEGGIIMTAIQQLHRRGAGRVTMVDILDCIDQIDPGVSRRKMNKLVSNWAARPTNSRFIQEAKLSENRYHQTRVRLAEPYKDYIRELIRIRRLLTEESPEANAFRAQSRQHAEEIVVSSEHIAQLLARSGDQSNHIAVRGDGDWARGIVSLIPLNGEIDTMSLHRKVVQVYKRDVVYRGFRDRLNQLAEIEVTERIGVGQRGTALGVVSLKRWAFPRDWMHDAACIDLDPELFSPLAGSGTVSAKVQKQVEQAKTICEGCPVKLACLKKALEDGEDNAVRGGVWFQQRYTRAFRLHEMPPERIRRIHATVDIAD